MNQATEIILIDYHYFSSLIDDINAAKQTILLEAYIFSGDMIGHEIASALCNAAKRGVNVRVLIDGFGSMGWGGAIADAFQQAGVDIRIYHPLPWYLSHWKYAPYLPNRFTSKLFYLITHINARNHRKVSIIDNKIVYVGSANITNVHLTYEMGGENWRDTTVKLTGINMQTLLASFNRVWSGASLNSVIRYTLRKPTIDPIFRLNDTVRQRRNYLRKLVREISAAKHRIWITNAYFNPNHKILKLLRSASRRGVDVRIIIPYKSDVFAVSLMTSMYYAMLIEAGVAVFEYLPRVLHAKILMIDDNYYVGSSNMNYRSLHHDLELDARIGTNDAKTMLVTQFTNDLLDSRQVTVNDLRSMSRLKRIAGWFLLYLRYWF